MSKNTSPPVVMIGLDGADWSLLHRLFDDGAMPTLQQFVKSGASATLESVLPINSMSAWTSLMTGVNPGKHGVYYFVQRSGTPFQPIVTNSTTIRAPTICETLSDLGQRSCVIDMPPFTPAFEIDGVMVGGIGRYGDAVPAYPSDIVSTLEEKAGGFADDVFWMEYQGRDQELVDDLVRMSQNRLDVAQVLLNEQEFELFCLIFVAPDRLHHPFWRDLMEDGPKYERARSFYVKLDEILARFLDRIDMSRTDVLIVSDHGFRRVDKLVSANQVLANAGLMTSTWREWVKARLMGLGLRSPVYRPELFKFFERRKWGSPWRLLPSSVAYSDVAETVSVNLAGREAEGLVPAAEFDEVRETVAAVLTEFQDPATGKTPMPKTVKREDYVHGDYAADGPDLVLEYEEGYAYTSTMGMTLWDWPFLQGVHSRDGIIACKGPHFREAAQVSTVSILDVTPTILALLGVAPPEDLDGRIAEELLASRPAITDRPAPSAQESQRTPQPYTEEEEEQVKERLRGLGYIE